MKSLTKKRKWAVALAPMLAGGLIGAFPLPASAAPWSTGDVFVAVSNGQYEQFTSGGTFLESLQVGTPNHMHQPPGFEAPVPSGGFTGSCAFNPEGFPAGPQNLYTTLWSERKIVVKSPTHPHATLATIDTAASGANGHPESIVFNSAGDFYVGLVDGTGPNLLKYSRTHPASGALPIAAYTAPTGVRGVDAMSLSANQNLIYYTSEDATIRTFNVVTGVPGSSFTTTTPLSTAYGLRILQGGNPFAPSGDGFLMVTDYNFNPGTGVETGVIRVFNQAGVQVNTYDAPNHNGWFSLSIKSGGSEFVAGDFRNGNVQTFNAAGPTTSFNANTDPFRVNGVCVRGEITPGVVPFPSDGFFIVGDVSAGFDGSFAVGNTVYFWGNEWAPNNTLSGPNNSNKSAFKGFAETTFPPTPFCNPPGPASTFESGGGASSAPPLVLPDQVAVIVTSTMSKSGDIKASGAVRAILLVQVNQGTYDNSSGGVGTGTVVRLVCGS